MTLSECNFLNKLFASYNNPSTIGVEIGSFLGRSAWSISKAIPLGKLICIDSWSGWTVTHYNAHLDKPYSPMDGTACTIEAFRSNTKDCANIVTVQGLVPECLEILIDPVDFVFLDAEHRNPSDRQVLDFWLERLKPGAILSGHDYFPNAPNLWPDVVTNVKWLEHTLDLKVQSHESIWYFKL